MKAAPSARLKLSIRGAVQGVGFRPFIHRLAAEHQLAGWVRNSSQGVFIEAEGPRAELEKFLRRVESEKPPRSLIQSIESIWLAAAGYRGFEIGESDVSGNKTALVLPDIATCPECLAEIFDPANRRYLYPFTNCTHCGPRFSIIEALPYDRANTSMKKFPMCPQCGGEYNDPANRRFHAQPNACPQCGPRLELWEAAADSSTGQRIRAHGQAALLAAARAIRHEQIVAVKGIGGFHLMVDARHDQAVRRLRARKHREEKPLAMLFPSLAGAKAVCDISQLEEQLLLSPEAPIVLLKKKECVVQIADAVAPGNPWRGVMLPSNPLHHLLMAELNFPVVATSGNLSEEPICIDESEALESLAQIADLFLVHDRPIVRHVDDSIVRVMSGREMILRRARGYAPLPIPSHGPGKTDGVNGEKTVLAVGGHLKNSVALAVGPQIFISQHIGDLETEKAEAAFRRVMGDFRKLYGVEPETISCDLHPDYISTKRAQAMGGELFGVQHHVAHVLSCMADNGLHSPALGVAWDGTGYGPDGTIWGGEFFLVDGSHVERVAHLRPFPLPGGDAAIREPRRAAIGLLYGMMGEAAFDSGLPVFEGLKAGELRMLKSILKSGVRSPLTSSVGRLFDAVSSLTGLRQVSRFEGQAAMELEFNLDKTNPAYPLPIRELNGSELDWQPMVEAILSDVRHNVPIGEISGKFHNAMVEGIVEIARQAARQCVVLSGGCFQNRYLLERAIARLREENFLPYWHHLVPTNDGGIALGQVIAAREQIVLNSKNAKSPADWPLPALIGAD